MNHQHPESRSDSLLLTIHSIFLTIQGEGPFTGRPAIFIRLAGCNLQCPGCDTDYTSHRHRMTPIDVAMKVFLLGDHLPYPPLIVITGGEPLRQSAVERLIEDFIAHGRIVQLETNGSYALGSVTKSCTILSSFSRGPAQRAPGLYIVCSPKTGSLSPALVPFIGAYKYVLQEGFIDEKDGLPTQALGHSAKPVVARPPEDYMERGFPVYVQPMDEGNPERNKLNLAACIQSAMKFGYLLQLQTHKIIGVQ